MLLSRRIGGRAPISAGL